MNRETLDRWCERGILFSVLAILIFGPLAIGAVRAQEFLVLQSLTILAVLLWGIRLWLNPKPKILWPPICWAVVAFVGYAIVRHLTSEIEYVGRQELIRVLVYALLFLVILNNLHRQESTRIITLTLVFLAMAISGYAIFQFMAKSDHVWNFVSPYKNRGMGTYICPNHLAGFLEMLLPLGLAHTLIGRHKLLMKIFIGYASLVIVAGIGVTVSRGSWIATGIALAVFFLLLFMKRSFRIQAAILLVILVCGSFLLIPRTYQSRKPAGKSFATQVYLGDMRFELWQPTIEMWRDNFWFGVGPGHFNYRFRQYRPDSVQLRPDHAHNDFLNTLADWGIIGATLVALACVLLFFGVIKTWKFVRVATDGIGKTQSNKFAAVLGASMGLLAIFFHSAVDFNMHIPANAILAVALMAILTSHLRFATESYWFNLPSVSKLLFMAVLFCGIGYLSYEDFHRTVEQKWLGRASRAPNFSDEQIAALGKAFQIEPQNSETAYNLGEAFRIQSWEGGEDYKKLAGKAIEWFERGIKLNPYDGYNYLRCGMCLDWLGRNDEAEIKFKRAAELDPNGYYTVALVGWHYVQVGDLVVAREYFERSLHLRQNDNEIAVSYYALVNRKLAEAAAKR